MKFATYMRAALAGACMISASAVFAAATDYAFEAVKADIANGKASELAVRLVHKQTGKPVAGAIIFRSRLDMSPDGMGDMTASLQALPSNEAGVYRFKADLTMAGQWALKVMAKVPGEAETLQGSVVFDAKD